MLTTPILLQTAPFCYDSTEVRTIEFVSIGGDQVEGCALEIYNMSNNSLEYSNTITSRLFQIDILKNALKNNNSYRYRLRTINSNKETSGWTQYFTFSCYTKPILCFNVKEDDIIRNSSLIIVGTYMQAENSPLFEYIFNLYDINDNLLNTSKSIRDDKFTYTFLGLKDNEQYKIEAVVQATNGIVTKSDKVTFNIEYENLNFQAILQLENVRNKGKIKATTDITSIKGVVIQNGKNISYEKDEIVDTTNGSQILYNEGFTIDKDFTLRIDAKMLIDNKDFLILPGKDDTNDLKKRIVLSYYNKQIHIRKINGINEYYICSDIIKFDDSTIKLIWIKQENNLMDIKV